MIRSRVLGAALFALLAGTATTSFAQDASPPQTPVQIPSTTVKAKPDKPAAAKPSATAPSETLPWSASGPAPAAGGANPPAKGTPWVSPDLGLPPPPAAAGKKAATAAPAAPSACQPLYEAACREAPECSWMADITLDSGKVVPSRCVDKRASGAKADKKPAKPSTKAAVVKPKPKPEAAVAAPNATPKVTETPPANAVAPPAAAVDGPAQAKAEAVGPLVKP